MLAEFVALAASVCTALSSVMATRGMKDSNPDTANLVLTGIQTFVLTGILCFDLPRFSPPAVFWFAVAGICSSFAGRLLTMISYKRLGVSTASAVIGTSPVVTTLLAILLLDEPMFVSVITGSLLVVAGIALINYQDGRLDLKLGFIYLPLGASLLYALGNIIRKVGTNLQPHAVMGAQVSTLSGLVACLAYMALRGGFESVQLNKQNFRWLVGAGIVNAVAWVAITMAINLGRVSVVTSIVYSYSLFILLLSNMILKDEVVSGYIVTGGLLIIGGVVLVSFFG